MEVWWSLGLKQIIALVSLVAGLGGGVFVRRKWQLLVVHG